MRRLVGGIARVRVEARGQVVAKALAHGAHLPTPPAAVLIVLDGMAVFVRDDVSVLAIVHSAIAKVDGVVARGVEGLILVVPVRVGQGREVPDAVGGPDVVIEAETVEVALYRVDGVVDHQLFEAWIGAIVCVDATRFVGIGHCLATRQRDQIHILTLEGAHAGVQALQGDVLELGVQGATGGVPIVDERGVPRSLDGIGGVHEARSCIEGDAILLEQQLARVCIDQTQEISQWRLRVDDALPDQRRRAVGTRIPHQLRSRGQPRGLHVGGGSSHGLGLSSRQLGNGVTGSQLPIVAVERLQGPVAPLVDGHEGVVDGNGCHRLLKSSVIALGALSLFDQQQIRHTRLQAQPCGVVLEEVMGPMLPWLQGFRVRARAQQQTSVPPLIDLAGQVIGVVGLGGRAQQPAGEQPQQSPGNEYSELSKRSTQAAAKILSPSRAAEIRGISHGASARSNEQTGASNILHAKLIIF